MSNSTPSPFQPIKDAIVESCSLGDYVHVVELVQQAWDIALASGHPADIAEAHWCAGLGDMHRDSSVALNHFDTAYKHYQDDPFLAARIQVNRGPLLGRMGRIDEAVAALTEAEITLRSGEHYHRLIPLLINRSDLEARAGHYAQMLVYAREAEEIALGCERPDSAAIACINQAFAAMFLGDLALAESRLERAREIATQAEYDDLVARVAVNQAHLHIFRDQLIQAMHLLKEARLRFPSELVVEEATVAIEEALLYERLGMFEDGYRSARTAFMVFDTHRLAEESVEAALLLLRLSITAETTLPPWIFDQQRWLVRDREMIWRRAAEISVQASPTLQAMLAALQAHPVLQPAADMAIRLAQIDATAERLTELQVPHAALQASLIAADIAASIRQQAAPRYQSLAIRAAELGLPSLEQQAYTGLARVSRGRSVSVALQRAVDLAASMRRAMPDEEMKARALTSQSLLHTRLVEAYLHEKRPEQALAALIEAKGGLWIDLIAPRRLETPDPVWITARTQLMFWEEKLREAFDGHAREICHNHIREALLILRATQHTREVLPIPSLIDIQSHIPAEAVAVEYMVGEKQVFACILTQTGIPQWVKLGKIAAILDVAERLSLRLLSLMRLPPEEQRLRAISQRQATDAILAELYDLLVKPLAELLGTAPLILAPDGALGDLPWAAFYDRSHPEQPYLGQQHLLSLVPTLALLASEYSSALAGPPLALGCADAQIAPYVTAELQTFTKIFPSGQVIPQASSADLKQAYRPAILHISAHGVLNPKQPLLSSIMLNDGPFLLADVFNLDLSATTLTILSACETNTISPLGGIALALSGAFLTTGVKAVIAGLWSIDAYAAQIFVERCYQILYDGATLELAIQQAQLAIRVAGYDHPYYWAAMQPLMRVCHLRIPLVYPEVQ